MPPAIVVYVDAWTSYGGSQFVDSPGTGLVHFEFFEAGHGGIDYRYPMSLAWLCGRITK